MTSSPGGHWLLAPCAVLKERSAALRVPARWARLPVSAPLGVAQPIAAPSRRSYHAAVVLSTWRPWASACDCRVGPVRAVACEAGRGRYSALRRAVNLVTWRRAQCHRGGRLRRVLLPCCGERNVRPPGRRCELTGSLRAPGAHLRPLAQQGVPPQRAQKPRMSSGDAARSSCNIPCTSLRHAVSRRAG